VVNLDDILTIPKARLTGRISTLSPQQMTAVARAVVFALDLKV
jgi:mRNA-degrading endonuclease toxin of MazEF toxin-antitoxin module